MKMTDALTFGGFLFAAGFSARAAAECAWWRQYSEQVLATVSSFVFVILAVAVFHGVFKEKQ